MRFDEVLDRLQSLPPEPAERDAARTELAADLENGIADLFMESHVPHSTITGLVLMRMGVRCMVKGGVPTEEIES